MSASAGGQSVLLGFSVCPLCGGKTHVKQRPEDGKKPYSHCVDEHDQGCSHTHYATNKAQAALMLAKTRPVKPLGGEGSPTPTPAADEPAAPSPTPASPPSATPTPQPAPPAATARRRGLW